MNEPGVPAMSDRVEASKARERGMFEVVLNDVAAGGHMERVPYCGKTRKLVGEMAVEIGFGRGQGWPSRNVDDVCVDVSDVRLERSDSLDIQCRVLEESVVFGLEKRRGESI